MQEELRDFQTDEMLQDSGLSTWPRLPCLGARLAMGDWRHFTLHRQQMIYDVQGMNAIDFFFFFLLFFFSLLTIHPLSFAFLRPSYFNSFSR